MQTARVTSIDALRRFKAALQQFKVHSERALIEADLELQRIDDWVRSEQPAYWAEQVHKRHEEAENAKNEVRKAQFTIDGRPPSAAEQKKALKKAQERLDEAKRKAEITRRWQVRIEQAANEYRAQIGLFASALQSDVPSGLVALDRAAAALESYTHVAAPELDKDLREETETSMTSAISGKVGEADPFADLPIAACRALRRLTLDPSRRGAVEAAREDEIADGAVNESTAEPILFRDALPLPRVKPPRNARVIVDPRAFSAGRIYLERVHVADAENENDDSGWHIGVVERREAGRGPDAVELQAITIARLSRLRPQWREVLSLPHGHLAVLEDDQMRRLLDPRDVDLLEHDAATDGPETSP